MESSWWHRLIWALVVLALASGCSAQSYLDSNIEDEIGLNTSQVLRLRGYLATDHTVLSQDGFAVNLVEAENPLVDYSSPYVARKEPVLFIHGTLFNATCFITDTPAPASPKDFSRYNASRMSHAGLESLYAGNPNSLSLVLILLDFGHKVYLLNRRNTIASQRAYAMANNMTYTENAPNNGSAAAAAALLDPAGLTDPNNAFTSYFASLAATVDSPRWNYSVDEAAQYDLPPVVDLILRLTGFRTLVAVGWSSGGQIIEMGLATQPDLNQKISKSLLWSPSLYLGPTFQDSLFYVLTQPLTNTYVGPILPQFFNDIISNLAARFCSNEATQQTICQGVIDFIGGYGDGTQRLKPGFFNSFPAPVSSHEFAQLGQNAIFPKPRHYSSTPAENQARYGSIDAPIYDVSKITSKGLYFWGAQYDGLVAINDVQRNVNDLSVPYVFYKLDQPGIFFEHFSYLFHKNKFQLLFIKCLKIIESYNQSVTV